MEKERLFTQEENYTTVEKALIGLSLFAMAFVIGITVIGFKLAGMI